MNQVSLKDWLPYPPDVSVHGAQIDHLITVVHYLMFALFAVWGIYFVYCLVRFRQREGHKAEYQPAKGKIAKTAEVAVIVAEALLLVGLSIPVWASWKNDFPPRNQAVVIRVVAEQFAWNFHYPGKDGVFGRTDVSLINNTGNSLGLDMKDPYAVDDIVTLNDLHVPVHHPVILEISSKDVIHSFTVNVLRVKQDAIPGMMVPIHFEATQTGLFDVGCAQLCGLGHYRMKGQITIDTPDQYAKWLTENTPQGGNQ
jgi:cytochrome c oxidase subunit II